MAEKELANLLEAWADLNDVERAEVMHALIETIRITPEFTEKRRYSANMVPMDLHDAWMAGVARKGVATASIVALLGALPTRAAESAVST